MGCPDKVDLGANLVFSITTHDPDTGVSTDADAAPAYRIYEDETGAAILTGTMAKLDDANTTGFYTELIACTVGNGFEVNKTYSIYIAATVDADPGAISYGVKCTDELTNILAILAMLDDARAEPGQGTPLANPDAMTKLDYLYKAWRNRTTQTPTEYALYNDDAATVDQKATVSDDNTTFDRGEVATGP